MILFRSTLARRLALLAVTAALMMPLATAAQDASPQASPVGIGHEIHSPTREEFKAELKAAFAGDEPPGNTDGTYVVGALGDLQSLNPFLVNSSPSLDVVSLVYEGLFGGDPRTGEPAPGALTDSWDIAADGVTYTFHLSKTARWQDGVDFTAADVDFSLQALADPATASTYTGAFNDAVASWRLVDDDTIQIVAKEVRFNFLYDIQAIYILPKHLWENVPHDQWAVDPGSTGQDPSRVVGTGPFKFVSWTQGQEVRLTRNDDYHDDKPNVKDYIFRIFSDGEAQFNAFLNGEIDVVGLEPQQVETVKGTPGLQWADYPDRSFNYYEFNLNPETTTLFQDREVRQALMYALDRDAIVQEIFGGFAEVAQGTQPQISYAYAPEEVRTTYTYDPEKAKQILAQAGWTDTNGNGTVDKDGQELSFELLYVSGSPTLDSLVAYMQDAWKAIGVDMKPQSLEMRALNDATTVNPTFQMAMYSFFWDATFIQDVLFGCDQYQVGFNDMKYCNPELDRINQEAKREFDKDKRRALLIEASNIVNDDQPIGLIAFSKGIAAWSDHVHNYHPSAWGNLSYVGIWVDS
jgi:peptide/nickel transport system substrate-binding protein